MTNVRVFWVSVLLRRTSQTGADGRKWDHQEQILEATSAVSASSTLIVQLLTSLRECLSRKFHSLGGLFPCRNLERLLKKKPSVTAPSFVTMNSGCRLVHSLEPISQRLRSYLWNFRPGQSMHEFLLHSRFPAHSALCEFTFGTNKSALVCQCGVDSIPPDFRAQVCKYLIANVSYKCSWSYF